MLAIELSCEILEVMAGNEQDPTFSEVFGLRQPSIEEVREVFETLSFAFENLSAPIGCTALFGVPGMPEEIMELSRLLGISYADDGSVEQGKAIEIAYGGIVATIEFFARLSLSLRS